MPAGLHRLIRLINHAGARPISGSFKFCGGDFYYLTWNMEMFMNGLTHLNRYNLVYSGILYAIFCAFGPLVVLIILNAFLIRRMVERKKLRSPNNVNAGQDNLTVMLITVVCAFMICVVPYSVIMMVYNIQTQTRSETYITSFFINYAENRVLITALRVSQFLLAVNSSINFLLYCLIWKKFRGLLCKMCCSTERAEDRDAP